MTDISSTPRYRPGDAKYAEIISVARDVIMTTGFDGMTISNLSKKVGMTRSLFYHYFKNKDAVAKAVLNEEISKYLGSLESWNARRETGNVEKALDDIVDVFYRAVDESSLFHQQLANSGNASLYIRFMSEVADTIADYLADTTVKDFVKYHPLPISNVHETFYMMTIGLISYIRSHPHAPKEVVKHVAAQTLHIEEYLKKDEVMAPS